MIRGFPPETFVVLGFLTRRGGTSLSMDAKGVAAPLHHLGRCPGRIENPSYGPPLDRDAWIGQNAPDVGFGSTPGGVALAGRVALAAGRNRVPLAPPVLFWGTA